MFERFTKRGRQVLVHAQEEAKQAGHAYIGTEHLLLALLDDRDGMAAKALTLLGVDAATCRERVLDLAPPSNEPAAKGKGGAPFTPKSKKVLELSLREALQMKHNYIGTEHLLLGMVREGEGTAAQVLAQFGVDQERARQAVRQVLAPATASAPVPGDDAGALRPARTPAAELLLAAARRHAGVGAPTSTVDFLVAMLDDPESLGAKVLASLGVTKEAVLVRAGEIGPAGTTDDVPRFRTEVTAEGLTIRVDDPAIAEKIRRGELVVRFDPPARPETPPESAA